RKGEKSFHFIEIMGCPGGCVGGGGQPIPTSWKIKAERAAAIYKEDDSREMRKSHVNPGITQIYKEFLEKPNSHKAHELLHTHYHARDNIR
ncbi:MAG TPA: iron hydrogenase small subunit, partial [bacterium]|nr:iron hydrogenase small subunit [bacterium]